MVSPQPEQAFYGLDSRQLDGAATAASASSSSRPSAPPDERPSFFRSVTSGLLAAATSAQSGATQSGYAQTGPSPSQPERESGGLFQTVTSGLMNAAASRRAGADPVQSGTLPSQSEADRGSFKMAAASGLLAATSEIMGVYAESKGRAVLERVSRLGGLLEVPRDPVALQCSLLYAQLSSAAYGSCESELHDVVSSLGCNLLRFVQQPVNEHVTHPQWFLCERPCGSRKELVVVIRGTGSVKDALADFLFEPKMHVTGDLFHKGFLEGALAVWDSGLKDELRRDQMQGRDVTLIGHSYGGAVAVALLGMGLLSDDNGASAQQWSWGRAGEKHTSYKVVTFGAPAVFHGKACKSKLLQQAVIEQWVCEDDLVPRLLGSDLSALHRLLGLVTTTTVDDATLKQVQGYEHLDSADLRILRDERAFKVPALVRRQVLQINGVLVNLPKAIQDHLMKGYIDRLQNLLRPSGLM